MATRNGRNGTGRSLQACSLLPSSPSIPAPCSPGCHPDIPTKCSESRTGQARSAHAEEIRRRSCRVSGRRSSRSTLCLSSSRWHQCTSPHSPDKRTYRQTQSRGRVERMAKLHQSRQKPHPRWHKEIRLALELVPLVAVEARPVVKPTLVGTRVLVLEISVL